MRITSTRHCERPQGAKQSQNRDCFLGLRPPRNDGSLSLADKDKRYLWHPFTQMKDWVQDDILIIERGEGCWLIDTQGNRYLDGVSSLWSNVHGHGVKEIDEAVKAQLGKIAHTTFLGLSHPTAIELAEKLIQIAPQGLTRVFYSDSGSEAVEIALKMAFQYWQLGGFPKKKKFVKLTNAYHGDTIGSVSVGGIDLFHEIYGPLLFETYAAPSPYVYRWPISPHPNPLPVGERGFLGYSLSLKERGNSLRYSPLPRGERVRVRGEALHEMEKILREHHAEIAAVVMEPLMQGAAGMIDQPQGFMSGVRELTKRYDVLLIFDEVATGFGRTGKMFASQHENVSPDLLAVAKGLSGGYLPLAATLTTEEVYSAFLGEYEEFKTFFHGHTFSANPLACAASLASLELFEKNHLLDHVTELESLMRSRLRDFYKIPIVGDIRQAGMMVGIELVRNPKTQEPFELKEQVGAKVARRARPKGALLRPLGSVVVLMPPLAIKEDELNRLLDIVFESIGEVCVNMP